VVQELRFVDLESERLSTMLKALSHPVRLEIVQILSASGDANCVDFTRHAGLAQSTVSEHLRVLKDAGLIKQCGPGPRSGYCIDKAGLVWMKQALVAL
jgi:DNA-binding transcriptional ArsR family regulator